ncbi:DUF3000 domain-containing protein [Thermobispora bispora]|jgi:hypothetical protein|uniref:Uncharacterized protein n=1 Tax=Thermobispora bispora (strain ATCC 19993 / DSM 43833 / CBS 139.67 / JCM 10125 / KCTC 9307 / NBRC 14880 / R51) TaxID=469371 RepID=D6Y3A0_THEBD|nr:DUF3000 domain-containing protein [Thermobispora bispora]MBO2474670.1 DUF3000 domain-containing protein [Actinomycetales bacterium]MDI9581587.1 DUF3000 domain-containing protein [Thermobispora sp.]ADG88975.1 hypothetical protein Tbis_2265 [Thermobispora bispora DSM 43833]MBX6168915.1 DUF3000 domain-containing protein [Thermobispora bispora]QSI48711.1 DUF3000 domain-containing protein [Thermobispora bispora]
MTVGEPSAPPAAFLRALETLRPTEVRPEIVLEDIPAPRRLAPYSGAVGATVYRGDEELAVGRLIMLFDPDGQRGWEGPFRLVAYVRAGMEPEITSDPLLGPVAWSWLTEALDAHGAAYAAAGGTVTRAVSEGFGNKEDDPVTTELELRASWSPLEEDLSSHAAAWCDLMCMAAGIPPVPADVATLPLHPTRRESPKAR